MVVAAFKRNFISNRTRMFQLRDNVKRVYITTRQAVSNQTAYNRIKRIHINIHDEHTLHRKCRQFYENKRKITKKTTH